MMNLNALLNSNDDDSTAKKHHHQQQHQQQHQQRPSQPPLTPVQQHGGAPQGFRDYSGPVHASPRNLSHDYPPPGPHASTPGGGPGAPPYASPGPYGSRPVPPPLQPLNSNDLRSPGSVSTPRSGPSPYRHTPTSSVSAGTSGGYPFPPTQPPSASSPVQHHQQYPPQGQPPRQQQPRDGYPQNRPTGPPVGMTGPGAPYLQGPPQQQQAQHPHQHPQQPPHPQQQQQHPQHPQHPQLQQPQLQHPQHVHLQGQQHPLHPLHPQHPQHPSQQHPQYPQHPSQQHPQYPQHPQHHQHHQQHQQGHPLQSPVGPPGSAPPPGYPAHQRPASAHSVPTPTSAQPPQLQQQQQQSSRYGSPYSQNSPVATHRQGPLTAQQQQQQQQQIPPLSQPPSHPTPHRSPYQQHQPAPFDPTRHPSQPPTPLGPPLSTNPQQQRATSSAQLQQQQKQPQHSQPASPLLQRLSTGPLPSSSAHPYLNQPNQKAQASPRSASSSVPTPSASARDSTRQQPTLRQGSGSSGQPEPSTASASASAGPPSVPGAPVLSEAASGPPSTSASHQRSLSRSDRALSVSVSVSPKTRVSSFPGGAPTMARPSPMDIDSSAQNSGPPAKRKLDERDLHPDELDRKDARRPAPFKKGTPQKQQQQQQSIPNAKALTSRPSSKAAHAAHSKPSARKTVAPKGSRPKTKRKPRYKEPPPWAREFGGQTLNQPNFVVRKHGGHGHGAGAKAVVKEQTMSGHASPEAARQASRIGGAGAGALAGDANAARASATARAAAGEKVPPSAVSAAAAIVAANEARLASLGPWEETVTGAKPYEELTRKVADFLYLNVVSNPNMMEIQQLDVQFEIEAKLGQLISKDTNQRIDLPVSSECLLQDTGRVTFKSSMTDVQHKAFNEYLNRLVIDTDARNPANSSKPRVPIMYTHRREIDRFFELPLGMQEQLPACVRNLLPHRHPVKVRVTYDKKTKGMLAKIVKARVADLNIYFPDSSLDCRLSVNLEMPWSGSVEELEKLAAASTRERPADREKDRLSYRQSHYQIDLTQVTYKIQGPQKMEREEKEHELEIEMAANMLIQQGRMAASGAPHAYQELVDGLVDNVRILTRRSGFQ